MRTLLFWHLGWRRFPRDMTALEVRRFFSAVRGPRIVEALVAGSSVTLDRYRLARQAREDLCPSIIRLGRKSHPVSLNSCSTGPIRRSYVISLERQRLLKLAPYMGQRQALDRPRRSCGGR